MQTMINLLNVTQKTKDLATRTPPKNGGELRCHESVHFLLYWWHPSVVLLLNYNYIICNKTIV